MTFYSEHGQDRWLEENVFRGKRDGVFVEFGAIDGLLFSNTLFFERERDWSGLLIEANPRAFVFLLLAPRPRSVKLLGAVAADYGIAEFTDVDGIVGWSGLTADMDERHIARIASRSGAGPTRSFLMSTIPLSAALERCRLWHVDYLSIDVEGAEETVLSTLDFERFDFAVIEVENNYGGTQVERLMRSRGYEKFHTIEINDLYRKSSGCAP